MSTITREWLKQTISELEQERDATPGVVNEDAVMALEAMRIALASLEAEPVAWRCGSTVTVNKPVADDWKRRGFAFHPLYAALPASVVPNGWVLVPKEPTPAMLNAAWVSHGIYHASAYRTMLAAAPQQEVKL
jgi:hypothetical protein